ncbi:hypothetical protein JCM19233_1238 [Vibrio astriarenae]|nr:hypothetical protein JCM19233_1238 [Vibrio sp. C7]
MSSAATTFEVFSAAKEGEDRRVATSVIVEALSKYFICFSLSCLDGCHIIWND